MESPTPRLSENNLRKLSRGFRSSKKSRLSAASDVESCSLQDGAMNGRSASLSTLLPSGGSGNTRRPRVDKLQTVEAKMASIEVSLGWRKRREVLLETLPRAARDLVRELDSLHQALRDKDSSIQSLRTQITNLGGSVKAEAPPTGGTQSPDPRGAVPGAPCLTGVERRRVEDRIKKVLSEIESKKVAVKNLRLTLDKIDMTDNIDVRIRAAEMEYELEREELNILNLREEVGVLESRLQETTSSPTPDHSNLSGFKNSPMEPQCNSRLATSSPNTTGLPHATISPHATMTLHDLLQDPDCLSTSSTLVAVTVHYTAGNPPFHVTSHGRPTECIVDWATDDTRLKRGDKLIEINGDLILGVIVEDVLKIIASRSFLHLVVLRVWTAPLSSNAPPGGGVAALTHARRLERQLEDRSRELRDLQSRLDKALKEKEEIKSDKTRLTHRISYLEDQVTELEETFKKSKDSSRNSASSSSSSSPAPASPPGTTVIQVYQKGQQTMAVARPGGADGTSGGERGRKYPTLAKCQALTSPPRRSSSSSSKSSGHNPSCASSSSGYASFTSFRSATSQSNYHGSSSNGGSHYETLEAIRSSARPSSSTENRRPRRILSPRPDSRSELDSRPSSRSKPLPPKKPERLSIQRASSLLSVDQAVSSGSSRHEPTMQDNQLLANPIWKSIGNGLNNTHADDEEITTPPSVRNLVVSKFRSEFISRRESSPMPTFGSSVRDAFNCDKNYVESDTLSGDSNDNDTTLHPINTSHYRQEDGLDYITEKHQDHPPAQSSWISLPRNEYRDLSSSPYHTASSSSYHTPSSGGSPCDTNGRPGRTDNLQDDFDDQPSQMSNISEQSSSSLTPTNSPTKVSPPRIATEKRTHTSFNRMADQAFGSDFSSVQAEHSYSPLPLKQTNHSGNISKSHGGHRTLSSLHNQKINHSSRNPPSVQEEQYNTTRNERFHCFTPNKVKENYPISTFVYGSSPSPKYESFSSLKRHSGRSNGHSGGPAPSTPITPRSNSSMKLRSPRTGEEDWC